MSTSKRTLPADAIIRAWSTLTVKSLDDDKRVIDGIASTPSTDSYGDIVEPHGAEFNLPLPLLSQHDASKPIGHVVKARVTNNGISVRAELAKPYANAPAAWVERLDVAWADIRSGLVRGLSIGFKALEYSFLEEGDGIRFSRWRWLELSSVTIPANADATVTAIKSIDMRARAALGQTRARAVKLISLPALGEQPAVRSRSGVKLIVRSKSHEENPSGTDQGSGEHAGSKARARQ